ncbi:putative leucine-rich repeat receptor-like serine/threonine-protein kinase [Ananas comosus]|uniref:Putative leucine-rich repeat receptor-like serine/threonine-protein kinase n=1 Tax=Ananas comosus TaxID=4615 RepID=A0A199UEQ8_ANACO|nr:putative leucine-rich repeat receptor-like serine/threonine-protein kinase [Ananas comosus]
MDGYTTPKADCELNLSSPSRGGFGKVYDGFLENGTQVAVKMRSQSSHQGVKEFLCEAQHLTRVHHKNLVSLIGYCKDGDYLGLVYEYMAEGILGLKIGGDNSHHHKTIRRGFSSDRMSSLII